MFTPFRWKLKNNIRKKETDVNIIFNRPFKIQCQYQMLFMPFRWKWKIIFAKKETDVNIISNRPCKIQCQYQMLFSPFGWKWKIHIWRRRKTPRCQYHICCWHLSYQYWKLILWIIKHLRIEIEFCLTIQNQMSIYIWKYLKIKHPRFEIEFRQTIQNQMSIYIVHTHQHLCANMPECFTS